MDQLSRRLDSALVVGTQSGGREVLYKEEKGIIYAVERRKLSYPGKETPRADEN